jgi:hypothetical protein
MPLLLSPHLTPCLCLGPGLLRLYLLPLPLTLPQQPH